MRLRRPSNIGGTSMRVRRGFIVRIALSSGEVGFGEAAPLESVGTESLAETEHALVSAQHPLCETNFDDVDSALVGLRLMPAARYGVELALLDALAKRLRLSVAEYLSGANNETLECSALLTD